MSVNPLILVRVVHYEGFKNMIRSLLLGWDCEENGVTHRFETQEDVLEFKVVFKAG